MTGIDFLFAIAVLIMSVIIHEVSHGYAAYLLGDPTAKHAGRLTLNPMRHLDFVGSFLVPMMTYFLGGFIFGWAKPVPYNPYNLKNQKWGPAIVGVAGPASNILVAAFFGLVMRFGGLFIALPASFFDLASLIVFINLLLAVFNMLPVPPLDGSKILFALMPYRWYEVRNFIERYGMFILLFIVFFLWRLIVPVVFVLFKLITGMGII